jgi:hypothetical protein
MKKVSFFMAHALMAALTLQAQDQIPVQPTEYKAFNASIQTLDDRAIYGSLYAVSDSQLVLKGSSGQLFSIASENLKTLSIKRKNSVLRGALIGFGIGVLSGAVIGFASGDDPIVQPGPDDFWGIGAAVSNSFAMTAGEKAIAGGIVMGVSGAIIGTVVGALVKKRFIIGGRKEKYRDLQADLMHRLVRK